MNIKRLFSFIPIVIGCIIFLSGCYGKTQQEEEKWTLIEEGITELSDGASVDLWRTNWSGNDSYRLSDGTVLLTVQDVSGPDEMYVGGVERFEDLNQTAQKEILAFYENQGVLYDLMSELEKAYAEYQNCREAGTNFNNLYISQDIAPTASNDHMICFLTSVMHPDHGKLQEERFAAVFDKETGEVLSQWNLFLPDEAETRKQLLTAAQLKNPVLWAEMDAAMKPEYIILFPDQLEIFFPQGSLPSQEYSYTLAIEYEKLQGIIQPWAVPAAAKE